MTKERDTPSTIATSPYDDPDVVLCTTDNVHFRVYKSCLSLASPFFKDMFKLPQPQSDSTADKGDRPIIPVAEGRKTIEMLLAFCYPGVDTTLTTFKDIKLVLMAMRKYDMNSCMEIVRKQLRSPPFMNEPLRVFAIAYHFNFRNEAILAMKESIRHPLLTSYVSELAFVPGSAHHDYFTYRIKCAERVMTLTDLKNPDNIWHQFPSYYCNCPKDYKYGLKTWFLDYVEAVVLLLHARPCAEVAGDPNLLKQPIQAAVNCSTCCHRVYDELTTFVRDQLVPGIQRAIDEVPVPLGLAIRRWIHTSKCSNMYY